MKLKVKEDIIWTDPQGVYPKTFIKEGCVVENLGDNFIKVIISKDNGVRTETLWNRDHQMNKYIWNELLKQHGIQRN